MHIKDSDWIWIILAAPILIAMGENMEPAARKRRRSNIIGLVTLVAFVMAIICYATYRSLQNAVKSNEAKALVNTLANDFAQGNSEVIMKWARGECRDPWENQIVLVASGSEGVQVASKGVDGESNTEDDVISDVYFPPKKITPKPEKKGVMSRIKSFFVGD